MNAGARIGARRSGQTECRPPAYPGAAILLLILAMPVWIACRKDAPAPVPAEPTPYTLNIPARFPTLLNIPQGNPMTVEGVRLGRYLFYDGRLSGRTHPDSLMSCATCHIQARGFECGIDHPRFVNGRPIGLAGVPTHHSMLPLVNLVWNSSGYNWNGSISASNGSHSAENLEDVLRLAITDPTEMNGDTARTAALFQSLKGYPELFRQAFGSDKITVTNMGKAIAQFVRTLVSADSRFDHFMRGEAVLTPSERSGYVLFMTEEGGDCFHCHGGEGNPLFTTHLFYNNGKDSTFTDPADRYAITKNPVDWGAYKAPTIRNLIFTAPYMHDGRYKTLDEVLAFYNSGLVWSSSISPLMHHIGTGGIRLTPAKLADLKAFLLTLTDSSFVTNPDFSMPEKFPDQP